MTSTIYMLTSLVRYQRHFRSSWGI